MAKEKAAEAATGLASVQDRVIVVPVATQGDFGALYGGLKVAVNTADLLSDILVQGIVTGLTKELQLALGPAHRAILKDRENGVEVTNEQARARVQAAFDARYAMWLQGKSGRIRGTEGGDPIERKMRALISAEFTANAKAKGL